MNSPKKISPYNIFVSYAIKHWMVLLDREHVEHHTITDKKGHRRKLDRVLKMSDDRALLAFITDEQENLSKWLFTIKQKNQKNSSDQLVLLSS